MENDPNLKLKKNDNIVNNISESKNIVNKEELKMESTNKKNIQHGLQIATSSGKGVTTYTNNSNSPKMGSRRIFTPQFKLQVLESYRNDNDCKGNQRATARKYNIHRRQIQKWLQCESSLRSSVANINHNSVKHQFHNVSVQQQQTKNVEIIHSSVSISSYTPSQLHSSHLCLDSTRGPISLNAIKVPSSSACLNTSTQGKHDNMFDGTNFAAAVSITSSCATSTSTVVVSPLRPSAIISGNRNASISPLLHHHHYGLPSYTSNMPPTVPILTHHHLSNPQQHMRQQIQPQHQTSYQYHHDMTYSATLSNRNETEKQQTSYFSPVINLPTINASTINSYNGGNTELTEKLDLDLIPMVSKAYPKFLCDSAMYESPDSTGVMYTSNISIPLPINKFKGDLSYSTSYPFVPMDLSLHHRRQEKPSELVTDIKSSFQNKETEQVEIPVKKILIGDKIDVVDLSYRKRKFLNMPNTSDAGYENDFAEKQPKLCDPDSVQKQYITCNVTEKCADHVTINLPNSNEDDDVEIEVGIEEKFPAPSSKPVKLFKPYLLDECETKVCKNIQSEELLDTISKSSFLNGFATTNDVFVPDNTFPDIVKESITSTSFDSSNFLTESRSESPRSACSPATSIATMSPTNFQYPKGSPASSGYESSTSTYSDSSFLSSINETYTYGQTYSVDLKMHTIYNENIHALYPSKHVQRWLEKDDSKPLTTNSSIALLV